MENLQGLKTEEIVAKKVDIVRVNLVKEFPLLYKNRRIANPGDAYELLKRFLGDVDREYFIALIKQSYIQGKFLNQLFYQMHTVL